MQNLQTETGPKETLLSSPRAPSANRSIEGQRVGSEECVCDATSPTLKRSLSGARAQLTPVNMANIRQIAESLNPGVGSRVSCQDFESIVLAAIHTAGHPLPRRVNYTPAPQVLTALTSAVRDLAQSSQLLSSPTVASTPRAKSVPTVPRAAKVSPGRRRAGTVGGQTVRPQSRPQTAKSPPPVAAEAPKPPPAGQHRARLLKTCMRALASPGYAQIVQFLGLTSEAVEKAVAALSEEEVEAKFASTEPPLVRIGLINNEAIDRVEAQEASWAAEADTAADAKIAKANLARQIKLVEQMRAVLRRPEERPVAISVDELLRRLPDRGEVTAAAPGFWLPTVLVAEDRLPLHSNLYEFEPIRHLATAKSTMDYISSQIGNVVVDESHIKLSVHSSRLYPSSPEHDRITVKVTVNSGGKRARFAYYAELALAEVESGATTIVVHFTDSPDSLLGINGQPCSLHIGCRQTPRDVPITIVGCFNLPKKAAQAPASLDKGKTVKGGASSAVEETKKSPSTKSGARKVEAGPSKSRPSNAGSNQRRGGPSREITLGITA